jgi:ATP-dependent helicase/DNAse subunit B
MPLNLIHGPPNSGRKGVLRRRFKAALDASPVLVVPNLDDAFSFEVELCREGAVLGGTVTTFNGLFGLVATAAGAPPSTLLTPAQRLRVCAIAIAGCRERLGPLRRSARRAGFAASLMSLLDELQAAGVDPAAIEASAATLEGSAYLSDLATLFNAYEDARAGAGRTDVHGVAREAIAALGDQSDAWAGRPVFVYGFDDLTANQLALLRHLSANTEVTISLPHEAGREELGSRPVFLARLREGVGAVVEEATEPDPANTPTLLLFDLERQFGSPAGELLNRTGDLSFLRSAGERGEAEAMAAKVGRLLYDGAKPDEIAVVLRDPSRRGPLLARVLESYGVPVALEAELPVASSGIGGSLLALLEAEHGTGRASDVLRWLRGPSGVRAGKVDWLERSVRVRRAQTAVEAWALWKEKWGELPEDVRRMREAEPRDVAAEIGLAATRFLGRDAGGGAPGPARRTERQAAAEISRAMGELTELDGGAPGPAEAIAFIRELRFRVWTGPPQGRVRIAGPERLRAERFDHVLIGSLQDGEFPRRGGGDPFLSDPQRESLGLDPRPDDDAHERYLFYASLSLARRTLTLSYRDCDEAGAAEARSPLVDEVRRLLAPAPPPEGPDELEESLTTGRGLADPVYPAPEAPSEDELARALAASSAAAASSLMDLAAPEEDARRRLEIRVAEARAAELRSRAPGPLTNQAVLGSLRTVPAYGGTTLELFDSCSYRWFTDHELSPQPLGPLPEAIVQGGLMHEVLERLYGDGEGPGGDPLPRPGSLAAWQERGRELVAEVTSARGLGERPVERGIRRTVEGLLSRFLEEEAERDPGVFAPWRLEAGFGAGEESEQPPLELDGWRLHGAIDRVDRAPDGRALVHDYKVASRASPAKKLEEDAKLQLQLYLIAVAELWGATPVAALYHPLRGTSERRPRGLVLGEEADGLPGLSLVGTDVLPREEFDALLAEARGRAGAIVARMREGEIRRDPGPRTGLKNHDVCPRFCDFAPICRRDRAPVVDDEREREES